MAELFRPPRCRYTIGDGYVVTDGSVKDKITGTSLGAILGESPYTSPFVAACRLVGVGEVDVTRKRAVEIGKELEPVLIQYADQTYGDVIGRFVPAEELYEARVGEHEDWASDFDDPVFAGHLDGKVITPDGQEYILEVKTSSHREDWEEGIPRHYYWQVALYNRFVTGKDKAYVLVGFTDEDTYRDTDAFIPCLNTVRLFTVEIDQEAVEKALEYAVEWYNEFIMNGRTPEYSEDNPRDRQMYGHLMNVAGSMDDVQELLLKADAVRGEISVHEAEIKALYDAKKSYDEELKDYLRSKDMAYLSVESGDSCTVTAEIRATDKKVLDEDMMVLDGIDLDRYRVTKTTYRMYVKRTENNKTGSTEDNNKIKE